MPLVLVRTAVLRPIILVAHRHDEWPMFRVWFTVATVVASIVFNLGIFFALVLGHMGLDVVKYRTLHHLKWGWVAIETVRESLMDIFFIVLGVLLAVIFHHTIAIGGLGRFGELPILLLDLILRVGPRLKIAEHILEVVTYWKYHFTAPFVPRTPLSQGERKVCYATLAVTAITLMLPILSSLTFENILHTAKRELTPRLEVNITRTIEELK
ncbi:MAG: hypothetical protein AAB853_05960 [Patescibacteria group bacterium]